ncbi:hypothetical protein Mp_7g10080 [Marchantia polymorpha subsp. ruderalis]|uniref:Uncharacterized protein n=2 Tax=Marchantia polymorpha TaxID=3197 RepID=A0AAF6BXZ8_MARPO|nr:hypothetical protein MARPO_0003s0027 [Marchantia polymorpha]BBN16882.1 hypothetical protein Mp_7g10080 [Marchantia polymorpha subsp. ruderalis]|eukprot:PTQ49122.1 hypothetical protein MARPO_0003s0027 [Marchantia polymorpha]
MIYGAPDLESVNCVSLTGPILRPAVLLKRTKNFTLENGYNHELNFNLFYPMKESCCFFFYLRRTIQIKFLCTLNLDL